MAAVIPEQFRDTEFLGGRQSQQANPDRLRLFQPHLAAEEKVLAVMPLKNSVLLVTDTRLVELTPHLEARGAWNVMGFTGFDVTAEMPRSALGALAVEEAADTPGLRGRLVLRFRGQGSTIEVVTELGGGTTRDAVARLQGILGTPSPPASG